MSRFFIPARTDRWDRTLTRPTEFFGRTPELDCIRGSLAAATHGQPQLVFVTGEAGIGKSRLVQEVVESVEGTHVMVGAAVPVTGSGIAFGPWLPIMKKVTGDVGFLTNRDESPDVGVRQRLETTRAVNLDACYQALSAASSEKLVVIVLEDLHWADEASLGLLAFIARRMRDERLSILATMRTDGAATPSMLMLMAELSRQPHVQRLHLEPLSRVEIEQIVTPHLRGIDSVDRFASVGRIYQESGGNTFLAVELAISGGTKRIPRQLTDVMLTRISGLSDPTLAALRALAILGRPCSHRLLAAIVGDSSANLVDSLRVAIGRGLLMIIDQDGSAEYCYRHGLMMTVVRDDLLPGDQQLWHRAVAAALSSPELQHNSTPGELAEHWYRAQLPARALDATITAGRHAISVVAAEQADLHLTRALKLWPQVAEPERLTGVMEWELLQLAAAASRWLGNLSRAVTLTEQALTLSCPPPARAGLHERLGRYRYESGDSAGALNSYDQALRQLQSEAPSVLLAQVEAAKASLLMISGHHRAAAAAAHQAAGTSASLSAPNQQAYALTTAGLSEVEIGLADQGLRDLNTARDLAEGCKDIEEQLRAEAAFCVAFDRLGRLRLALEAAQRALTITRRYQLDGSLGLATIANALDLLRVLGRWQEADELADSVPSGPTSQHYRSFFLVMRSQINLARGRYDRVEVDLAEAEGLIGAAVSSRPDIAVPLWASKAELALSRGAVAAAWDCVSPAIELLRTVEQPQRTAWICALAMRIIADDSSQHGRKRASSEMTSDRVEVLRRTVEVIESDSGLGPQGAAWASTFRAELGRWSGRGDCPGWQDALSEWQKLGRPFEQAYALWRLAEDFAVSGQRTRAADALIRGMEVAKGVGAEPLVSELNSLAKRSRLPLTVNKAPRAVRSTSGLTKREFDVLHLITEGRSNRQIARTLFISEKTASVHVSNILAKLHAETRTEAARIAFQLDMLKGYD